MPGDAPEAIDKMAEDWKGRADDAGRLSRAWLALRAAPPTTAAPVSEIPPRLVQSEQHKRADHGGMTSQPASEAGGPIPTRRMFVRRWADRLRSNGGSTKPETAKDHPFNSDKMLKELYDNVPEARAWMDDAADAIDFKATTESQCRPYRTK